MSESNWWQDDQFLVIGPFKIQWNIGAAHNRIITWPTAHVNTCVWTCRWFAQTFDWETHHISVFLFMFPSALFESQIYDFIWESDKHALLSDQIRWSQTHKQADLSIPVYSISLIYLEHVFLTEFKRVSWTLPLSVSQADSPAPHSRHWLKVQSIWRSGTIACVSCKRVEWRNALNGKCCVDVALRLTMLTMGVFLHIFH